MSRIDKLARKAKRKARVRGKIFGTSERPRLTVSKTLKNIYAQIIDDEKMVTLVSTSTIAKDVRAKVGEKSKTERAQIVGEEIARVAQDKGVKAVAFDRNGNVYHGRVKALAEAARKAGLDF
ncbi:MAG TPA: 50S ribosomal protein L18 [candidate division Zixibacteria bacterium]|nr:50S ribosomal protein L18 [candidate division Zixibacteria bacterium]